MSKCGLVCYLELQNTPSHQILTNPLAFATLSSNVADLESNTEILRFLLENTATEAIEINGIVYTLCTCGELVATSADEYLQQ